MISGAPLDLARFLDEGRRDVDRALDALCPPPETRPEALHRAMRYTLLLPGKRIRPLITVACAAMLRGRREVALPLGCAIEMVHASSLILDDLPSQDNATLRRGQPTLHRVAGEADATLASVALLTHAFRTVATVEGLRDRSRNECVAVLAEAVGGRGLIAGQVVDLACTGSVIGLDELEYIHSHKTGALFLAAAELGAIAAGGRTRDREALRGFAKNLGLAFQITDDVLDATGEPSVTGKDAGMDRDHTTFVSLCGVDGAQRLVDELIDASLGCLAPFGKRAALLRDLGELVRGRDR